ncbi:S-adenosyl-L-methionine-dependent methyltransferase [Hygrophoropsis aurantiaca]|uniref:S-adenosyl-L-methionine-dependent methyltransferase n=1 Tax=Hygrophoropsis aurantiaca TaxID=72124 RepID=A0ACB8AC33_9AGAM|nr:S-adenosyl-L-methionine-dependent methyltransferase [Hygrophoropsis aurantiaca]
MLDSAMQVGYGLLDKGLIPDFLLRLAIRALCRQRLREIDHGSAEANHAAKMDWIEGVRARDTIADATQKANEQHYEVSTKFILSCLGPFAKYSSCLYPTGKETLEEAEVLMLENYCRKASLQDGIDMLDLGCGWGSLSLYLAAKYPNARITGLSNSATQKAYIDSTAKARGLKNIQVVTADVNTFDFKDGKRFDRIVSIEMFEHMKNYEVLLRKVSTWLKPTTKEHPDDSLLFVHIFCHKSTPYHFEEGDGWMAQTFFSGGTMPSHDLFAYFQSDLTLIRSWYINGRHYSRTLEDWLKKQDRNGQQGLAELEQDAEAKGLDKEEGRKAFYRFRVFYMACSELFAMNGGEEWGVGHYLFKRAK